MSDPAQIIHIQLSVATHDPRDDAPARVLREAQRCLHLTFGDAITVTLEGHD